MEGLISEKTFKKHYFRAKTLIHVAQKVRWILRKPKLKPQNLRILTQGTLLSDLSLFFVASYMNKPHSASEYHNVQSMDSVCWPAGQIPPVSTPVTELSRICSLVGMPQPDFSFLRTPQVWCTTVLLFA